LDAGNLPSPPERLLSNGDTISLGNIRFEVLHTPPHTPGSLCFKAGRYLISGDTISPGGLGVTRTPADFRQIIKSITEKLNKEKEEFAVFSSRTHDPKLCGQMLWLSS